MSSLYEEFAADKKRDRELVKAGSRYIESAIKMANAMLGEEELFSRGYWICDKGDRFAHGQARSPSQCPSCRSLLFKWIPGR
jgi:rubrerythrin